MQVMSYLNERERDLLAVWRAKEISIREIGRRLKRHPSVISRELKRNGYGANGYVAILAQAKAIRRKRRAGLRQPLKYPWLYSHVIERLGWSWTPEIIAGRLKREHGKPVISYETIYRFIYDPKNKNRKLWQYLPRGHRKRRRWYGRKSRKELIPNRVSIHQRPEVINSRKVFGHWEGDSVIGKGHQEAVHTEVERLSRYFQAKLLKSFDSNQTVLAQWRIFKQLPDKARKTVTLDNGLEFVEHEELTDSLGIKVFFADPYCSCQRGTNENTNGLLRRYLPKGTSFKTLDQAELDDIVAEINSRPKKCLNWATPEEVFLSYTKKGGSGCCNSG